MTFPVQHIPFPLVEAAVLVQIEDRGGCLANLFYDLLTFLDNRGFCLFSLVQVLDTPKGSLRLAVLDLARIDAALVQDVVELVEMLQG